MNIGVLYSRSGAYPALNMEFLDGLRSCLKKEGLDSSIKLNTESIGFGGDEKEVYEKAEKLLVIEDVDILLAYIDLRVSDILEPLVYASGKLMIIVNPGANYPQNWVAQPGIAYLNFQHAFLCWLSGSVAGKEKPGKAALASTFYDCGYLHTAAMVKSFNKAGGNLVYNYINKDVYDETFNIGPLTKFLSSDKETSTLLCVFDSLPASLFYNRLNDFEEAGKLHLFVSPMMMEEKALDIPAGGFKFSIDGYLAWNSALENASNKEFTAFYETQVKKKPTMFTVLGWESGLIISAIYSKCSDDIRNGSSLIACLKKTKLLGPRGSLLLDDQTNYFTAPVFKYTLARNSVKPVITEITNVDNEWKEFINEPMSGIISGWTNTYLCY